jgi:diaminohydroxyphosphoribosylaminopyrimidine deaminase/5-amino-6-(5-phosphoribosylamino)uracil reductase
MEQHLPHEFFMQRCITLASRAQGHTYPNPMVGAVVVHGGLIIGEGYHCKAGQPHAEVNAINSVKDASLLPNSTLYVNLEPCAHHGKTPPCSLLIIEKKIPRVVIGCLDTFSEVAGKGIEMLKNAGVDVVVGVLENESRFLNRRFFTYHEQKRPYIILKWAQTLDGFIDIDRSHEAFGNPTWVTNNWARQEVHRVRGFEQAIVVGTNTALKDNPSLTVRHWVGQQPLRIVLDRLLRLPLSLSLFDGSSPTLVVTEKAGLPKLNVEYFQLKFDDDFLINLLSELHKKGIQSVIVEGGAQVLQSFIDKQLWDESHCFVGNRWFYSGVKAPVISSRLIENYQYNDSQLFVYSNNFVI